jgi:hypothetical protein
MCVTWRGACVCMCVPMPYMQFTLEYVLYSWISRTPVQQVCSLYSASLLSIFGTFALPGPVSWLSIFMGTTRVSSCICISSYRELARPCMVSLHVLSSWRVLGLLSPGRLRRLRTGLSVTVSGLNCDSDLYSSLAGPSAQLTWLISARCPAHLLIGPSLRAFISHMRSYSLRCPAGAHDNDPTEEVSGLTLAEHGSRLSLVPLVPFHWCRNRGPQSDQVASEPRG